MKLLKHAYLLLCLVTFSFLTNCSSDDDNGGTNNIEKDYFTIENATYIDNNLPAGTAQLLSDLNITNHVVNGGSTLVNFSSAKKLKSLNVGVKGINGYYEVKLPETTPKSETTDGEYDYQVILAVNQNISVKNFKLALSVTSADGQISPVTESKDISIIEAGTGKLQVTLSWDQEDDLDLHVITPSGKHVSYANDMILKDRSSDEFYFDFCIYLIGKYTDYDVSELDYDNEDDWDILEDYLKEFAKEENNKEIYIEEWTEYLKNSQDEIIAYLDIDSNPACDIDGIKNENIFFNEVENGEYLIAVDLYDKCGNNRNRTGAKYSVTLNYGGQAIKFSDNQTGQFSSDNQGSGDREDKYVIIGKFKITDAKSGTVKSTDEKNNALSKKFRKNFRKTK